MMKRALLQQLVMLSRVKDGMFGFARCEHLANACDLSCNKGMPLDIQYKTMYLIQ